MTDSARTLRPEELLAETEWLRALALHLVRDPGAAEDAAQETSIAALRSPPAGERRPWLAQVLRNFTRQRHRAESRRARREETAVARAREARPDEVVERVETHRLLAELVASLSEPNRTAVAMRYYDDLTPSEIAARLGVPAGTVRARIHRGLAELRERLDERHRSDREAWIAALAPLAYGGRGRIGARTATGARTTSATTALVAATLVAAVAVVGVAISLSSSGGGAAPGTGETSTAAAATQGALARRVRSADEQPPAPEPPPRGDLVRLAGTVLDPTGAPVRDAVVVANPVREPHDTWDWFAASDDAQHRAPPRRVVSSAGGGFALDAAKGGRVAVSATAPGLASAAVRVDANADKSDLVLRLAPALGLAGDVWDEAARPIAGAVVVIQRGANDVATVVTDDGGRFDVPALAPVPERFGGETSLLVAAREFAPVRVGVVVGRGRIRVVLPRGQFVEGRVVEADGRGVAGATVTIQPIQPSAPAPVSGRADETGRFRIGRVGATDRFAFNVHVVTPGHGKHVVSQLVAPAPAPLEVRLPEVRPLRGRVVDSDGKPVVGAHVVQRESIWWTAAEFNGGEGVGAPQRSAVSGEDGAFEVACAASCFRAYLAIDDDDPSWTSELVEIDPKATPPDSKTFEVCAKPRPAPAPLRGVTGDVPLAGVTGRVEDAEGHGLVDALVAVGYADAAQTVTTGPDGEWRLREVPAGSSVSAWAEGFVAVGKGEPAFVTSARAPTLVLIAGSPVTGTVIDVAGAPVAGVLLRTEIDTGRGWSSGETRSDAGGAFAFACVPPGKGRLVAIASRANDTTTSQELVVPSAPLRVALPRGFRISGRAVHADGAPIASAYLTWLREGASPQDRRSGDQVTNADGRFEIVGLPEGTYRIDVERFVRARGVAGGATDLEMRSGLPRAIAGRVTGPDAASLAKATVVLARDDGPPDSGSVMWRGPWQYQAQLDAEGRFRIEDIRDGTYAVYVEGVAGAATAVVRGVRPGDEGVEVRLVAPREVAGVLVDVDGRPVRGGVAVAPAAGFGPSAYAQSGDDGRFRVAVAAEGDVVVEAWASGNKVARTTATPPASGEMRIEVTPKR